MLSKSQKLNSIEHKKVLSGGGRFHTPFFTLYFLKNNQDITRCSVVVSKKVAKKAVERNKNKRKVFDSIQNIYPHIKSGYDFIIMTRPAFTDISKKELDMQIKDVFKRFLN